MAEPKANEWMEKLVSLCKRRGFIFQSSEIYGGINGFWDYGPLGAELKRNIRNLWWTSMTQDRDDIVGLDATIIMHPDIWKASGHVDTFADLMVECPSCQKRYRADQVDARSGIVYRCQGAEGLPANAPKADPAVTPPPPLPRQRVEFAFEALVPPGKPIDNGQNKARDFYKRRCDLKYGVPFGESFGEEIKDSAAYCPDPACGAKLTAPRPFNLMFKSHYGPVESDENICYLRPETAQAIFVQFKNVLDTSRQKVPFGIAQVGKAFRNEVTPRNFTFRSREFEQMELEFFIRPDEAVEVLAGNVARLEPSTDLSTPQPNWGWEVWHKHWVESRIRWYESIGLPRASLEEYWQKKEELAHYAKACVDILFQFPFGTQELEGIAARGDFDLSQHQKFTGKSMEVFDEELKTAAAKLDADARARLTAKWTAEWTQRGRSAEEAKAYAEKILKGAYVPHVIEPSAGADRLALALLCKAYSEDQAPNDKGEPESRVLMKLHPRTAPLKVGVFPLLKNRPELVQKAKEVRDLLRPHLPVFYDEAGAIGRRYRRQDEAGTPFGVTIDFDTLGEKGPELKDTVTVRDRDSLKQDRVRIADLLAFLLERIR